MARQIRVLITLSLSVPCTQTPITIMAGKGGTLSHCDSIRQTQEARRRRFGNDILKPSPRCRCCSPSGRQDRCPLSRAWLKRSPNVRVRSPLGSVTSASSWLKPLPNVKLCSPSGNFTLPSGMSNMSPNVKSCRWVGNVVWSNLWLNLLPNVKDRRSVGSNVSSSD